MLSAFSDVLIADATILRLHDFLQGRYPACRTNHTQAAAKLHLVFSVLGQSEQKVKLTGERKKESQVWTIGAWVRNRLLLFDLGFFKYALLDRIDACGGFFISRLKGLCNPTIVAVHQGCQGRLLGCKLKDALGFIRREILDVEVEVSYKKRKYKGKRRTVRRSFRVVGIKNPTNQTYHLYITNIPAYILPAQAIAHIYTARWLIELVFKQLKSFYGLEGFPSSNPHIVHTLIYSALITMLLSQNIQQLLVDQATQEQTTRGGEEVFPLLRLAAVLRTYCKKLLERVLRQAGVKPSPLSLTELIRREARDPNRRRPTLPQRLHRLSA